MSLTEAIEFRYLSSQLTDDERHKFFSNLLVSHTNVILNALSNHIIKANTTHEVNDFNATLRDIIRTRKEKPKVECTRNITLHQFPRAIIGYTASFLDQYNYINFSMSNRAIYLGCNSPNVLQILNLNDLQDYSSIDLSLFPSIKSLDIDPNKVMQLKAFHFNQISTLILRADNKCHWVQQFLDRNIINCDTVTVLRCNDFGTINTQMEGGEFLNLLKKFTNLKDLELDTVHIKAHVTADPDDIANYVCHNISGLYLYGEIGDEITSVKNDLIRIFANKLKYLTFEELDDDALDFEDISFDQLEELRMMTLKQQTMTHILKSALNIKKIYFEEDDMSSIEIKTVMEDILLKCSFLKYVRCNYVPQSHFCSILQGIECGLFKTKKQKRKEMKFEICIYHEGDAQRRHDFGLEVDRVINLLEACDIDDFMLILQFKGKYFDEDVLQQIFEDLSNASSLSTKVFQYEQKCVVTNVYCKMSGYQDTICGY